MSQMKSNNKNFIFPGIILFFIVYGFSINGVNMKYPFMGIVFLYIAIRFRKYIMQPYLSSYLFVLVMLCLYSALTALINSTGDYFETFRFLRCIITVILISVVVSAYRINGYEMYRILKILLLLNSVAVILCIIFPSFRNLIQPISQYTKDYYALRASGLLNGEDASGFFCVFGLILETVERIYMKKSPLSIVSIIFVISTLFTSRFSLVFSVVVLIIDAYILWKRKEKKKLFGLLIVVIPIALVALIFLAMTTGAFPSLRIKLSAIPAFQAFYQEVSESYIDYGVYTSVISRHTTIDDINNIEKIIGVGHRSDIKQDSGYIKTIYAIGMVGVIVEILFFSIMSRKMTIISRNHGYKDYLAIAFGICIFIMLIWEFKISFMFANGFFELFICMFISVGINID